MTEIHPYTEQFFSRVVDVILPIQQSEFDIPITLDAQPDLIDIPGFYQQRNGNFWIALIGSEVAGTIALKDIGNREGALRKMFVKAEYRGAATGVSNNLLQVLLRWCEQKRFRYLYLGTTPKFLAAHRFYEKNGFTEIEKDELPETFPVMTVDTKFYKYSF